MKERGDDLPKPPETVRERISKANNLGPKIGSDGIKTSGSIKPKRISISVDFPEPEGPTTPITLLIGIAILSPSRAGSCLFGYVAS